MDDSDKFANKTNLRSSLPERAKSANLVPFFMRAWWLKDFVESEAISFGEHSTRTSLMFSTHTDPMCDASNTDTNIL
jgi:hypothetical protein